MAFGSEFLGFSFNPIKFSHGLFVFILMELDLGLSSFFYFFFLLGRDNFILLHGLMAVLGCYSLPFFTNLPLWNWKGCIYALILHMGVSEPLYYWMHKRLHTGYLFTHYHSMHHASTVTHSFTGTDH